MLGGMERRPVCGLVLTLVASWLAPPDSGADASNGSGATATLRCKFTANGSDAYRVDTYTSAARASNGLGALVADGSAEVYRTVILRKIA